MKGTDNGPTSGKCELYSFDKCIDTACLTLNHCSSCIANTECGWCGDKKLCTPGNRNGPAMLDFQCT